MRDWEPIIRELETHVLILSEELDPLPSATGLAALLRDARSDINDAIDTLRVLRAMP